MPPFTPSSRRDYAFAVAVLVALSGCSPAEMPLPDASTSDSGFDGASNIDASMGCSGGQQSCSGVCADLQTDRRNCGACGAVCTGASVCTAGRCVPTCPSGQSACGTNCVTLSSDPSNCGACGTACTGGQVCSRGVCDLVCAPSLTRCGPSSGADGGVSDGGASDAGSGRDRCVDVRTDDLNCGGCGRACASGERCVAGACQRSCSAGQMLCGTSCSSVQTDPANCGMCGRACTAAQVCVAGSCVTSCPSGQSACSGTCADLQNDPRNCGVCGTACSGSQVCVMGACATRCPASQTACSGRCVDTSRDGSNCGACGTVCAAGQLCSAGACVNQCVMGNVLCGSRCVDTSADPRNCGGCGTTCAAGQVCSGGACMASCTMGSIVCGSTCADTSSDNLNCGACGTVCAAGNSCVSGTCRPLAMIDGGCAPPSQICSGVCTDNRTSNSHCGRCGNACSADRLCVNGACVVACNAGETRCGAMGTCTDTTRDSANCGMCGRTCAMGESCAAGTCVPDPSFRMTSFSNTTADCRISVNVESMGAGDQGSGLVATASSVFYTGDTSTVFLPAMDLSTSTQVSPATVHELLASDLRGNVAYVMALATGASIPAFGSGTITQLRALNSTGAFSGATVMLSRAIAFPSSSYAIYSGYGRIIVWIGSGADMGYWQIEMPSGVVTRLTGTTAPTSPYTCERGGHWGIAEFFGGDHYVVYLRSGTGIVRQRVRDGMNTTILAMTSFGDGCTVGLSAARNRWFMQYEATPPWAPAGSTGEHVVSCPATWDQP